MPWVAAAGATFLSRHSIDGGVIDDADESVDEADDTDESVDEAEVIIVGRHVLVGRLVWELPTRLDLWPAGQLD
jgi:hypothetical protein